jgi:hypothetical protein
MPTSTSLFATAATSALLCAPIVLGGAPLPTPPLPTPVLAVVVGTLGVCAGETSGAPAAAPIRSRSLCSMRRRSLRSDPPPRCTMVLCASGSGWPREMRAGEGGWVLARGDAGRDAGREAARDVTLEGGIEGGIEGGNDGAPGEGGRKEVEETDGEGDEQCDAGREELLEEISLSLSDSLSDGDRIDGEAERGRLATCCPEERVGDGAGEGTRRPKTMVKAPLGRCAKEESPPQRETFALGTCVAVVPPPASPPPPPPPPPAAARLCGGATAWPPAERCTARLAYDAGGGGGKGSEDATSAPAAASTPSDGVPSEGDPRWRVDATTCGCDCACDAGGFCCTSWSCCACRRNVRSSRSRMAVSASWCCSCASLKRARRSSSSHSRLRVMSACSSASRALTSRALVVVRLHEDGSPAGTGVGRVSFVAAVRSGVSCTPASSGWHPTIAAVAAVATATAAAASASSEQIS